MLEMVGRDVRMVERKTWARGLVERVTRVLGGNGTGPELR